MWPDRNNTSDAVFKILPRATIRAAIFVLQQASSFTRGHVRRSEDISQVTDGVAEAQALLNDQKLSWTLTVQCGSPTDHALWALLEEARMWTTVLCVCSYGQVNICGVVLNRGT